MAYASVHICTCASTLQSSIVHMHSVSSGRTMCAQAKTERKYNNIVQISTSSDHAQCNPLQQSVIMYVQQKRSKGAMPPAQAQQGPLLNGTEQLFNCRRCTAVCALTWARICSSKYIYRSVYRSNCHISMGYALDRGPHSELVQRAHYFT
eukprot:5093-Heterococcus_DN1.PRE.1